jgi:hypothetical protein
MAPEAGETGAPATIRVASTTHTWTVPDEHQALRKERGAGLTSRVLSGGHRSVLP